MDNLFITRYFDWQLQRRSVYDRLINRVLEKLGIDVHFESAAAFDSLVNRLMRRAGLTRPAEPMGAIYSGQMTSVEQRINMYHLLSQVLAYGVPGDVVELGCHEGHSAVLFQQVIRAYDPGRALHLYDSFRGLPTKTAADGKRFQSGWLAATEQAVLANFRRYELPPPQIHAGWFNETLPDQLPGQIAFAHLDGDFHDSILTSLENVYPRLTRGAVCLIDDYCDPAANPQGWNMLPGVKRACDEYLRDKPETVSELYAGCCSHGFFRKQ